MGEINGVKNASQYACQDNTVQGSLSATRLTRSAISLINGVSGALAITNFPGTTFIGMVLDRCLRGRCLEERNEPETKNVDDSRPVLTEMERNGLLETKLLSSAFRCGLLCLAVLNPDRGLGIMPYLAAASFGVQFHNYVEKRWSALAVKEVAKIPVELDPFHHSFFIYHTE